MSHKTFFNKKVTFRWFNQTTETIIILLRTRVLFPSSPGQVLLNPPEGQLGHYVALQLSRQLFLSAYSLSDPFYKSSCPFICLLIFCLSPVLALCLRLYLCVCAQTAHNFFPQIWSLGSTGHVVICKSPRHICELNLCNCLLSLVDTLTMKRGEERKVSSFYDRASQLKADCPRVGKTDRS